MSTVKQHYPDYIAIPDVVFDALEKRVINGEQLCLILYAEYKSQTLGQPWEFNAKEVCHFFTDKKNRKKITPEDVQRYQQAFDDLVARNLLAEIGVQPGSEL